MRHHEERPEPSASDAERWRRLQEVFHDAAELPPPSRAVFLETACGSDTALRRQVEDLLDAGDEADDLLKRAVQGTLEIASRSFDGELRVGRYRLLRELGRGGLATVYLGERADDEFRMQVAVKLVRRGMDSDDILDRLRQERQILANLDHPNIAKLLDGGSTDDGVPYFVMELIDGEPIDVYCDRQRLSVAERLELLLQVASAVQYAHRNLVIHRDLKPSNILVTADRTPKLLDFGIAKLLRPGPAEVPVHTQPEVRLLTPEYASPEQVRGEALTTGTDVYSLGVVLYRLLTGHPPYRLEGGSPRELERIVCEVEPERPSAAIDRREEVWDGAGERREATAASVSAARRETPERLRRRLIGDLDNIVLAALRKESERRYGSVGLLADDLRRYLVGLPVTARPATVGYRLRKFVARYRVGVAVAAAVLALVAGLVGFYTARLRGERDRAAEARVLAERSAAEARQVSDFLRDLLENADPGRARGEEVTVRQVLERGADEIERLAEQPELQASLMTLIGNVDQSLANPDRARRLLEGALAIRRQLHGEESVEAARAKIELEELLFDLGDLSGAEQLAEEALATFRRQHDGDHPDVAQCLSNLATVRYSQGDLAAAALLLDESLAIWRRLPSDAAEGVVTALHNLAVVRHDQGDSAAAEALYFETRDRKRALLGEDHPDVAAVDFNLATLYADQGRLEEARELLERVRSLERRLYGTDHPNVLGTTYELALLLGRGGEVEAAEGLYREALAGLRRTQPAGELTVWSLLDLGDLRLRQGDPAGAEGPLREAIEILRNTEDADPCTVATAEGRLGVSLRRLRRDAEAESLLRSSSGALAACDGSIEEERRALEALVAIYGTQGEAARSEPLARRLAELGE